MSEGAACTHGERERARVVAKILAAVLDYSEQAARQAEEGRVLWRLNGETLDERVSLMVHCRQPRGGSKVNGEGVNFQALPTFEGKANVIYLSGEHTRRKHADTR